MPLRAKYMYRGLPRTFLVPDTLQFYTSLGLTFTVIVSSFADHLVCSRRTSLYINMAGSNTY